MKTFRLFGRQFDFHFRVRKVKRMIFDLPASANDAHLRQGSFGDWGTPDGKSKVTYFLKGGNKPTFLDLPDCKSCQQVFVTPMYQIKNNTKVRVFNRVLVVDVYL